MRPRLLAVLASATGPATIMFTRKTPVGPKFDDAADSALLRAGVRPDLAYDQLVAGVRARCAFDIQVARFPDKKPENMRSTAEGGCFVKLAHLRWNPESVDKIKHARQSMATAFPNEAGRCYFARDNEAAVEHMLQHKNLAKWREQQVRFLKRTAKSAMRYDMLLRQAHPPPSTVRRLNQHYHLGLIAVLLDAIDHPDKSLVNDLLQGVPVCGDLSGVDTGIYRRLPEHAEPLQDFLDRFQAWEQTHDDWLTEDRDRVTERMHTLRARAAAGDRTAHRDLDTARGVYEATLDEVKKGLMGPAMSEAQLRQQFEVDGLLTVRVMPRFGVLQGWTDKRCRGCRRGKMQCRRCKGHKMRKLRCCDDGRKSGTNYNTRMSETTVFPTFEFTARAAASVHHQQPGRDLLLGLDDLASAYRRVPTSQPRFTVVSCWDFDRKAVSYFQVYGL